MNCRLFPSMALAGILAAVPSFGAIKIPLHQNDAAAAQIENAQLALNDATRQADRLLSMSRLQNLDFVTHAGHLTYLKQDVNRLGNALQKLENIPELSQWQKSAVDRIQKSGPILAARTTNAIARLNEERNPVFATGYRQDLQQIYSTAKSLNASLHRLEKLHDVRTKLHQLNQKEQQLSEQTGS